MRHVSPILGTPVDVEVTPYTRDRWRLVRCSETGLVFLPDPPAYEELAETFAWERTTVAEAEDRRRREPIFSATSRWWKRTRGRFQRGRNRIADLSLKRLHERRSTPARPRTTGRIRIVDLGCAGGDRVLDLCARLARDGHEVVPIGIEISAALAHVAGPRFEALGGTVHACNAIEGARRLEAGSVDLVVMSAFLEHEARPRELMDAIRPSLRPDGVVVLKVPNFGCWNRLLRGGNWCGFRYPDHVNYFTPSTLARLATETGYRVMPPTWGDLMPTSDNMYATLTPSHPGASSA